MHIVECGIIEFHDNGNRIILKNTPFKYDKYMVLIGKVAYCFDIFKSVDIYRDRGLMVLKLKDDEARTIFAVSEKIDINNYDPKIIT